MQKVSLNKGIKIYNDFLLLLLSSVGILVKKLNFFGRQLVISWEKHAFCVRFQ